MFVPDFADPRILAGYLWLFLVVVTVQILGGKPEKLGIYTLLSSIIAQLTLRSFFGGPRFDQVDQVAIVVEVIILAGFLGIMLNANRIWPIFAFAMSLISMLAHFARFNTEMLGFSYAQFKAIPTVTTSALLLIGVVGHQLRLRSVGEDPDWVPFAKYREYRKIAAKTGL